MVGTDHEIPYEERDKGGGRDEDRGTDDQDLPRSPRVTHDLRAAGWRVGENTVARLMAEFGLGGRKPKRRRSLTRQGKRAAAPDRVRRQFTAVAPNLLWCGDLTEVDTDEGKLYLATVLDLFSRRMLGYATSEHHDADLATAALRMAAANRRGRVDGVTGVASTPPRCSRRPASGWVSCSPWGASAVLWTMPRPKRSTRPSRSSTSTATPSAPGLTPA
jgi:putative transposase